MENGSWRDASTLDFGAAIKRSTAYYTCKSCGELLVVSESTCGVICSHCDTYNPLREEDRIQIPMHPNHLTSGPHVANWDLIKYRKGMENQAESWKSKQEAKVKSNNGKPIHHGPRIKGERTK